MVIDVVFIVVALWGMYLGFSRGIIQTIFTIVSIVFGLMMGFRFGPQVTSLLEQTLSDNALMFIAGFLITFVGTMFVIRLLARALEGVLEAANINFINRVIGGMFLSGIMILIYSVLLWFGDRSHLINDEAKRLSVTYEYLEQFPTYVWDWGGRLRPVLEDFWQHSIEFMDKLEEAGVQREESDPYIYNKDDDPE
jgi:membrane protein required for colicin V production